MHGDEKSKLREAIAQVEGAMSAALALVQSNECNVAIHELRNTFSRLVKLLALGPEPAVRDCPSCGRKVMREATLCGYCWSRLPPPTTEHPEPRLAEAV